MAKQWKKTRFKRFSEILKKWCSRDYDTNDKWMNKLEGDASWNYVNFILENDNEWHGTHQKIIKQKQKTRRNYNMQDFTNPFGSFPTAPVPPQNTTPTQPVSVAAPSKHLQQQAPQQGVSYVPTQTEPVSVAPATPTNPAVKPVSKLEKDIKSLSKKSTIKYHIQLSHWTGKAYDFAEFEADSANDVLDRLADLKESSLAIKSAIDASQPQSTAPSTATQPIFQSQQQFVAQQHQQPQGVPVQSQQLPGLVNPPSQPYIPPQPQVQTWVSKYVPNQSPLYATPNFNHPIRSNPTAQEYADLVRLNVIGQNGQIPTNWKKVLGITDPLAKFDPNRPYTKQQGFQKTY